MTAEPEPISYDDQAEVFEARAGLPEPVAVAVAGAVRDYAALAPGDLLLEIGAGTGLIGRWLARAPLRYLGLDRSRPMLEVFRPRLRECAGAAAVHTDAGAGWPVRDGCAAAVFGSRVLHLLAPSHVLREAGRVAHPRGAVLVCGRVAHDPGSPRAMARRKLRELLTEHGLRPRPSGGQPAELFALARAGGAEPLAARVAATWQETLTVAQVLGWWRGKTSIGGVNPPPAVADAVLAALASWGTETFGRLSNAVPTRARYLLEGVRLSPARPAVAARQEGARR